MYFNKNWLITYQGTFFSHWSVSVYMKVKIITTLALFKLNFSTGIPSHDFEYGINEESIFRSRNIFDIVSIDLNDEVLSIVTGKIQNKSKLAANP